MKSITTLNSPWQSCAEEMDALARVGCANELELLIKFRGEQQKLNGLKISMIVEKRCDHPQARSKAELIIMG